MRKNQLLRKSLSILLAVTILLAMALPAAASEVTFTTLVSPKYEDAESFSDGLAAVKQGGKWGYIDEDGKLVISCQFDKAYPFSEGLAIVGKIQQQEGWHWTGDLDEWDNWVMEDGMGDAYVWYILDANGKTTPLMFDTYEWDDETGESRPVEIPLFGFCQEVDAVTQSPYFYNGYVNLLNYCLYGTMDYGPYNLVYDRQGNRLELENEYLVISGSLTEGLFAAYMPATPDWYFLDESGQVVLQNSADQMGSVRSFNQGLAPISCYVESENRTLIGFIDKTGKTVIAPQFTDFYFMAVSTAQKVFNDGIASMEKDGKWGGIDKTGKTVIPFTYDFLNSFLEGLAVAEKNGKYGVIDTSNRTVIPFAYDRLSGFQNGFCVAVKDGRAFCIDRYGNEIPGSASVDASVYFPGGLDSTEILAPDEIIVVQEGGKYGYMTMEYTADLPKAGEMDSWAYEEIVAAIEAGLIPNSYQNQYKTSITRADFAALAVELITTITGKTGEELVAEETGMTMDELVATYPFLDANSESILVASALGIINGKGDGVFDPYGLLTRQDAATMLMRAGQFLGLTDPEGTAAAFSDAGAVAAYAQEAVEYVNVLGVMQGTSDTTFSPRGTYTRQQAYLTFYRLYEALQ